MLNTNVVENDVLMTRNKYFLQPFPSRGFSKWIVNGGKISVVFAVWLLNFVMSPRPLSRISLPPVAPPETTLDAELWNQSVMIRGGLTASSQSADEGPWMVKGPAGRRRTAPSSGCGTTSCRTAGV